MRFEGKKLNQPFDGTGMFTTTWLKPADDTSLWVFGQASFSPAQEQCKWRVRAEDATGLGTEWVVYFPQPVVQSDPGWGNQPPPAMEWLPQPDPDPSGFWSDPGSDPWSDPWGE